MDEQDYYLKRPTLSSRLVKLSPAKQALLEKWRRGKSLSRSRHIQAPIERVARDRELPLTFLLEDLLEQIQSNPNVDVGILNRCFRLTGAFDQAAMEMTVNELARRHETLRTRFPQVNGRLSQVIEPPAMPGLPVIDLSDVPEAERLEKALGMLAEEAQRPYDLSGNKLWRVLLVRLSESDHFLLLSVSHLIADVASMDILVKDSWTLYRAFSTGRPSPLAELPIQFADYAYWQRKTLQGQVLEDLTSYWKRQLEGLKPVPELRLPFERPLPAEKSERSVEIQHLKVPATLLASLKDFSRREGVSLFMLLFAALITILHRYTGKHDFGILSPIANRHRPETGGAVGWFADYIVLRIRPSGLETFSELLQCVRTVVLDAYEHQDLPFFKFYGNNSDVWAKARAYSSLRFNMTLGAESREDNAPQSGEAAQMPGLVLASITLPQPKPKSLSPPGLNVFVQESEKQLDVSITHELERHEAAAVRELLQNYLIVLEGAIVSPEQRLAEFPLVLKTVRQ